MVLDLAGRQERLRHCPESRHGGASTAAARTGGRGGNRRGGWSARLWSARLRRRSAGLLPPVGIRTLLRIRILRLGISRLGLALVTPENIFSRRYGSFGA